VREAYQSPHLSAEVKNSSSYTSRTRTSS